jgi:hypothetical protein
MTDKDYTDGSGATSLLTSIAERLRTEPLEIVAQISRNQNYKHERRNKKRRSIKQGYYQNIWIDSGWELSFLLYHIDHKIPVERNADKFPYYFQGIKKNYIPDFKYPDGTYIEIKGKEPAICLYKYAAVPTGKLKILYAKDMQMYIRYVIKKYGKKYWSVLKDKPW